MKAVPADAGFTPFSIGLASDTIRGHDVKKRVLA